MALAARSRPSSAMVRLSDFVRSYALWNRSQTAPPLPPAQRLRRVEYQAMQEQWSYGVRVAAEPKRTLASV